MGAAMNHSLTLVIAPAGFGKSTLLAEWCEILRAQGHLIAWLSLDGDDDPDQFCAYLVASFLRGTGSIGSRAATAVCNAPLTPTRAEISILLNEISTCGKQVFLVLDDFDRLDSLAVRAIASRVLRYAPENLHILLGVRSEPRVGLGHLQIGGQLLRIGESDLRFSADDAQAFFAQTGSVTLDRRSVELLHDATEGWIAGLQLASLSLRSTGDVGRIAQDLMSSRLGVDAYLHEMVLERLPAAMLQFLLRTSILERMSPRLCDALMGAGARSWEKLDWLERNNLFTRSLDPERKWFRYHALLSEALRRRASLQFPDDLPKLHRRASRWFASEQLWPEAVRHALAAGEAAQAAAWVEQCAMALLERSDVGTLLALITKLPANLVNSRPRLRIAKIWSLLLLMRMRDARSDLSALLSDMARGGIETLTIKDQFDLAFRAEVATIEATIAGFDDESERALEFGQIASDSRVVVSPWVRRFSEAAQIFGLLYGGRSDEVERIRLDADATKIHGHEPLYAGVYRTSMFGLNLLVNGKLPEATVRFESALTYAESAVGPDSAAAALPSGYLSLLYYEANDLVSAHRIIDARLGTTFDACPLGSILRYCYTASRLHVCNGEFGLALQVLEHGREIAHERDWLRLRAACDAEEVRICLDLGWVNRAQETAETLSTLISSHLPKSMGSFLETWASWCTLNARLDISLGKTDRAIRSLGELKEELSQRGMVYLAARTSIILALALHQDGAHDAAFAALAEALRYAQVNRMIRSFIDEGQPMRQLLTKFRESAPNQQGIDIKFTDAVINAPDLPAAQLERTDAMNAKALLSTRELEILNHIGHGLSNKEIARALRIAPETVKWHLKNIFEKLQVSTRLEAIQRGLGIPRASRRG